MCLDIQEKYSLTYNLWFSETAVCCWSKISGASEWPPWFGTSAAVYSQLLAPGAGETFPPEEILKWL